MRSNGPCAETERCVSSSPRSTTIGLGHVCFIDVECIVIAAGIIGLSVARALALVGREVVVLEVEHGIGRGISSGNSEVIHGGLYYPPGSLKARF